MSDSKKLKPNPHYQAYEAAEAKCKEKYPQIEECMDITNVNVDMRECKKILEKFSECFNVHKPEALRQLLDRK